MKEKILQRKLMENWMKLPEKEKKKFRSEEDKRKRLELQEIRENLWRMRNKDIKKRIKNGKNQGKLEKDQEIEDKIKNIENILERVKAEDKERKIKEVREIEEKKR